MNSQQLFGAVFCLGLVGVWGIELPSAFAQQAMPGAGATARMVAQAATSRREQLSAQRAASAAKAAVARASDSTPRLRVAPSAVYKARVEKVIDGQTLLVNQNGEKKTVRLWGVASPLVQAPDNKTAREYLSRTLDGQFVRVEERGPMVGGMVPALVTAEGGLSAPPRPSRSPDTNGVAHDLPYIARANPIAGGQDVTRYASASEALIRAGLAHFDGRVSADTDGAAKLKQAEVDAQKDGKGLWAKPAK